MKKNFFSIELICDKCHRRIASPKEALLEWSLPKASENQDTKTWYCKIYRDGKVIKEVYNDQTSYIDSTVAEDKTYKYSISVVNYFFKESPLSVEIDLTIK